MAAWVNGIASVTLYEAIVPRFPGHQLLVGQLNDLPSLPQPQGHEKYHWPTVANTALATSLRHLFPGASAGSRPPLRSLEQHFAGEFQSEVRPRFFTHSVTQGQVIADAVFDWVATDGYTTLNNCPFTPPSGPGLWVPTPPTFAPNPLQPCWGQLVPFVLSSGLSARRHLTRPTLRTQLPSSSSMPRRSMIQSTLDGRPADHRQVLG